MSTPRMEIAIGVIDGINKDFKTVIDYRPGTVKPSVEGLLRPSMITELGGKDFQIDPAPQAGDQVAVFYETI